MASLTRIHHQLFQDVYDWAGELRTAMSYTMIALRSVGWGGRRSASEAIPIGIGSMGIVASLLDPSYA